ncbi:MAG: response regulator [Spongiibacteraceae bacterium]
MDKMSKILLVDDCEATNFLHRLVIEEYGCAENVVDARNGKEAIEYLREINRDNGVQPELIFLDINMPVMDGWGFLEAYDQLDFDTRNSVVIVMLTTSLNPDDAARAAKGRNVKSFFSKPLTDEKLHSILLQYCPEKARAE